MNLNSDVLAAVLLELLRKAGDEGLTKTQIIKLVFFVDLEACRQTGEQLTDCSYKTYTYGIVDFAIWDKVEAMQSDFPNIEIRRGQTSYGSPNQKAILKKDNIPPAPAHIAELVDKIWSLYGGLSAAKLGERTKKLVPMDDEWEINIPIDVRDIAFETSAEFGQMVRKCRDDFDNFHSGIKPIKDILVLARDGD